MPGEQGVGGLGEQVALGVSGHRELPSARAAMVRSTSVVPPRIVYDGATSSAWASRDSNSEDDSGSGS